jgi:hypothetical protein
VKYIPDVLTPPGFSDRPQFVAVDSTGRVVYSTKTSLLGAVGTLRKAKVPPGMTESEVKLIVEHAEMLENEAFTGIAHIRGMNAVRTGGDDNLFGFDHVPGNRAALLFATQASPADMVNTLVAQGSDALARAGQWSVENVGFRDTTYVSASGNGGWVVIGEGSRDPVGRILMREAAVEDGISGAISVDDLMINGSETVEGIGLNYDGTLGVALGSLEASFFSTDLRLQGSSVIIPGASGAVLHPLHANSKSVDNPTGLYQPDTHLAFVDSGDKTIEIIDTFHFIVSGKLYIKDLPSGPLKAVLPFPGDNVGLTCATRVVLDDVGNNIGDAVEIFQGGDFNTPHPAGGGPTEDSCIVVKLVGITDVGGVVVVDVRKSDVLRLHPSRN